MSFHDLLTSCRDMIVSQFAEQQKQSHLIDHIPMFLDEIVDELQRHEEDDEQEEEGANQQERACPTRHIDTPTQSQGDDLDFVIREYSHLRHAILATAKLNHVALTIDEFNVLAKYLDSRVADATLTNGRIRDEQLRVQQSNLDYVAKAGKRLSSSLDVVSIVDELLLLFVPRLADWGVVCLNRTIFGELASRDTETIRVLHSDSTKMESLRALYHLAPSDDIARTSEHADLVAKLGIKSSVTIPLRSRENDVLGVLTMGGVDDDDARASSSADLTLATELIQRASLAIDNAHLYEISQRERSRVEGAMRAKDEFLATVSHELRTPLNAILGWATLLKSGRVASNKLDHAFEVIERNAKAQSQVVSDLLDISSLAHGQARLTVAAADLASLVDVVVRDLGPCVTAKGISMKIDLGATPAVVYADAGRLRQVVWNVLTNAIKFVPKSGGEISIALHPIDADYELVVSDNGIGIDPRFLPHIFESFSQSSSGFSRSHGGLGTGLSITKHIVDLHGGSIQAKSDGLNHGASFVIRLPAEAPSPATTRSAERGVSSVAEA